MVRLLASDNMIPERKPWETFVDPAFLAQAYDDTPLPIGEEQTQWDVLSV